MAIASSTVGLLTDSVTMSKPTNSLKTEAKKMVKMNTLTIDGNVDTQVNELSAMEVSILDQESQTWDTNKIDTMLKASLEYRDYQLSINEKKLNLQSLPFEVSGHLDEALAKLNELVSQGIIEVEVINNKVELTYPDNNGIMSANDVEDNDVFYYDDPNTMRAENAYMWFTKYGPKHWWQFWKWGAYLHFSESAVVGARALNIITKFLSFFSLAQEVRDIQKTINEISTANIIGDSSEVNEGLKDLSKSLGGMSLEILGNVIDILAVISMVLGLVTALMNATGVLAPFIDLIIGMTELITGKIVKADRGKGVKWQLICFVIPGSFFAE